MTQHELEKKVLAQLGDLRGRIERMIETTTAELSEAVDVMDEMEQLFTPKDEAQKGD